MFSCIKHSFTFYQHLGPQILRLVNTKNQPNGNFKKKIPCKMDFVAFKIIMSYII
jgi:hypothetical protein